MRMKYTPGKARSDKRMMESGTGDRRQNVCSTQHAGTTCKAYEYARREEGRAEDRK